MYTYSYISLIETCMYVCTICIYCNINFFFFRRENKILYIMYVINVEISSSFFFSLHFVYKFFYNK